MGDHVKAKAESASQLFVRKSRDDHHCYRCGDDFRLLQPSVGARRQFEKLTGRAFPRSHVSLNVEADAKTLGVREAGRGSFCCDCAVAYMTEFNRLLQNRHP